MIRTCRATLISLGGLLIAIGCGGGKAQDAAATNPPSTQRPVQLAQAPAETTEPSSNGGTVHGSVKFTGTAPAPERIKMDADPQCKLQHPEAVNKQDVVVNANGTLQHVFVYVKEGLQGKTFPAPQQAATMDQHGCMYQPHVLGIQVGQPLEIINSDATLHNVNCKPTKSKPFNMAQPTKGMKSLKSFTAPEVMVKCVCNVHPWMAGYIGVLDHPFFSVTGEDGAFHIANLPAGDYTIEAWHEKFGTQSKQVTVAPGQASDITFEFAGQ